MKEIYKKIIEKLFSPEVVQLFNDAGVTPVRCVDLFRGQYQSWENFEVSPLPAVFVDWQATITDPTQNESMLSVTLHLVYEQVLDTSNFTTDQDTALKFFDFMSIVHTAISAIQVDGSGKLKIRRQEPAELDRPGIVHLLTYETAFSGFLIDIRETFDYTEPEELTLEETGKLVQNKNWETNDFNFDLL